MTTDEKMEVVATIDDEADIIMALEVLGGSALMGGNRRLYEHIYKAKVEYDKGVDLGWSLNIGKK